MGSYAQGDSLTDYETIPEDEKENSNGVSALGDYPIQVLPEWPLDDSLLQGNSSAGIEQPTVIPFGSRAINWRRPGTATDPTSPTAYINGYFSSWNVWSFNPVLSAQQNIQNQAKNIDLILRQSKASFAALEQNDSLIAQEFYNITNSTNSAVSALKAMDTHLDAEIKKSNTRITALETANNLSPVTDLLTLISNRIRDLQTYVVYINDKLVTQNNTLANSLDYQKNISAYQSILNNNIVLVSDRLKDSNSFLTGINDKLLFLNTETSLQGMALKNISDYQSVLVTSIDNVASKVQKIIDLFNVTKIEPGTFTFFLQGSIKTQTDAIIQALAMVDSSINKNFINYFDDSINGKFWKAFKKFDDFQMAVFFGVFFDNYRLELEKTWVNTLEVWNTTNGYLNSSYNALVIITQWLKQIYEKPSTPAIVNVPPFDYQRLERMLKKLEFGEITNEAGTNIWDFLKSLIDNLGEIITTQMEEFSKILGEILDFLDKFIDKLIGLIVPEDTNFISSGFNGVKMKFNVKFGALLGLADSLKDIFKPTPQDFTKAVSFEFLGAKFEPDFSLIDPYVQKFRVVMSLSLWMSVVVFIFKKITGTGDLVNDS